MILRLHSLPNDAHNLKGENLSEFEFRKNVSDGLVINNALSEGLLSKIPYRPNELKDSIKSWTAPKDLSQDEVIMLDHSSPDSQIICTNEILEYLEILDREYFRYIVKITRGQKDQFAKLGQRYKGILADIELAIKELQAFEKWLSSLTLFKFDDELNAADLFRFLSSHLKVDFRKFDESQFDSKADYFRYIAENIYTKFNDNEIKQATYKSQGGHKANEDIILDTHQNQQPIKDKWDKKEFVVMGKPPLQHFPLSFYY